jgi:uncharacterized protein (TIGR02246 family)
MRHGLSVVMLICAAGLAVPCLAVEHDKDEAAIRELERRTDDAWNRHDTAAYGQRYATDADSVNVLGWWWQGRAQITQRVAEAHAVIFRHSVLRTDEIKIRFLRPDIAVVHVRWSMTGALTPDGKPVPSRTGLRTEILQKQDGHWLISAVHNTDSSPEVPFPSEQTQK